MKVGLISDTHAYLDPKLPSILADCDEIWHAGDVGNLILEDHFDQPVRAVYGNIDSAEIRHRYPQDLWLRHENQSILMTHIAGRPNRYPARVKALLRQEPVIALICGHSHIPLVQRHPELPLLHINPGAAGRHGFHKVRTIIRFEWVATGIQNMELIELGPRSISK